MTMTAMLTMTTHDEQFITALGSFACMPNEPIMYVKDRFFPYLCLVKKIKKIHKRYVAIGEHVLKNKRSESTR